MQFEHGDTDFLFMGDAGANSEAAMIGAGLLDRVDVLKVGHHGSRYSSTQAFLNVVNPAIAVYMAGIGNTYGHPHPETLAALASMGVKVYGTRQEWDYRSQHRRSHALGDYCAMKSKSGDEIARGDQGRIVAHD